MEVDKDKIAGGFFWAYGEKILAQLVSLLVSIILARLLSLENYGVISIVMIFITLSEAFVTGGFGSAIVQKQNADELDVNTMFFCSLLTSLLLYSVIFISAPFIASFYKMEILSPVLRVLGIRLLLSGINSIQRAWIQKKMLFKKFFIATSFGTIISAIVGISMAATGFGVWALVSQYLTNTFIDTLVLFFTNDWKPKLQFSFMRAKGMLSYAWKVLTSTIVYTIGGDLRSLIIGKRFGAADLAYYDQGKKFPNLFVDNILSTISNVMFPVLVQVHDKREQLKQIFRKSVKLEFFILSPLLIGLISIADSLVLVVFSEKWLPCVPYLRILTAMYLMRPFSNTCQQLVLADGKSEIFLKIIIAINCVSIGVLLYSVFVLNSIMGIAVGVLIAEFVGLMLFMYHAKKLIGYNIKEQLSDTIPCLLHSSIMGILVYSIQFLPISNDVITLILQMIVGVCFYIVSSYLLKLESFSYLITILIEKHPRFNRILSKFIRKGK